ncbi:MAG TPA: flagellar biosynthesis anti-sigma factor FlgM [Geobacter sp.]|nr:flagellar biosynthesis anti-sigma factor FlgM [Geobacter sp.]
MKIEELNTNPALTHLAVARADKEQADAHGEAAARPQAAADKVELSSYMPVVPTSQQRKDSRVERIEELKAQVAGGTYQVPGKAIAEKMLGKLVVSSLRQ